VSNVLYHLRLVAKSLKRDRWFTLVMVLSQALSVSIFVTALTTAQRYSNMTGQLRGDVFRVEGDRNGALAHFYKNTQFEGLGASATSRRYAVKSVEEATAYLRHPVLGARLRECAQAVLDIDERSATDIFGSPDDMKLRSCATLFAHVSQEGSAFHHIIDKYFAGRHDERTLKLIDRARLPKERN